MDRDVAMSLKSKLTNINTVLHLIATGVANTDENNRSISAGDQRSLPESDMEEPEAPEEEPEPITKEKK